MAKERLQTRLTRSDSSVKYINNHIAFYSDGVIYVNKALKKYPKLYDRVIEHELKHEAGDSLVDFKEGINWRIILFVLTNPSSWSVFLPVRFFDGKIVYDPVLVFLSTVLFFLIAFSVCFL